MAARMHLATVVVVAAAAAAAAADASLLLVVITFPSMDYNSESTNPHRAPYEIIIVNNSVSTVRDKKCFSYFFFFFVFFVVVVGDGQESRLAEARTYYEYGFLIRYQHFKKFGALKNLLV